jgi:phosphinothricin acetyltransferase
MLYGSRGIRIYMDRNAGGRGVGRQLLTALLEVARDRAYWKWVARIVSFNAGSRALCRSCEFREVGVYEKHCRLHGQWLDVVIVERLIREDLSACDAIGTASQPVSTWEDSAHRTASEW